MFSDFAYLDRAIFMLACLLFTLHRIWTANYEVLSWKSLRRVELKSVAVLLLIISMTVMVAYDLTAAVIKYREGFWVDQVTAIIITRPREKYTPENRVLFPAISVMLNLSWTIQCTALFLMTALWNHMSKAMFNKPFMTSFEFKVYSVYSVFIFAVYPFLQIMYFFVPNVYVSAFVPLLLYLFQILVLIALTVLANKRFQRLKHQLPNETSAQQRIKYYSTMNNYLALSLACIFIGLSAVTIDAITTDILFYNKFLLDFFTKIFNFGFCMSFPIALFILVPKVLPYSESMMPLSPLAAPRYKHFTMKDSHLSINATPELPMHPPHADSGRKSPVNVVRDTNGFFRIQ